MNTKQILKLMHILTWIVFIGLCIKTGVILISYLVSINNPEASKNLFGGLNLYQYYNFSFRVFVFYI